MNKKYSGLTVSHLKTMLEKITFSNIKLKYEKRCSHGCHCICKIFRSAFDRVENTLIMIYPQVK